MKFLSVLFLTVALNANATVCVLEGSEVTSNTGTHFSAWVSCDGKTTETLQPVADGSQATEELSGHLAKVQKTYKVQLVGCQSYERQRLPDSHRVRHVCTLKN